LIRLIPFTPPYQHEGLGYLVLGQKRSGNPYGAQDIAVLEIISRELLLAIQNVLRFEEIRNFNITLQQRIEDATRKLRRTNEKLRRLDEIKDDFISMASHQLRTPLTSVKGYVSMVLEGDAGGLTPMQKKLLNQSFISSQRMAYLISDLLNVSRLRTGKFIIDPVPCNLAQVVQDEVAQLQETVKGRNLTLEYHKPERFPILMIDETKIRQVIMNFIDNAIYYTPSGGRITVKLSETPKTIELAVTDNGIGVPKHERHRLFTKFFRAHNAQKARPDGTGLGLFMAKKVIIAQGGAVIFKSQEGKGSTFGFTFPKAALVAPPKSEAPPKPQPAQPLQPAAALTKTGVGESPSHEADDKKT
jgi:signal transduction histidine kinase